MAENGIHPIVNKAREELRNGGITRREFMKYATLVGMTLGAADFLAACAGAASTTPGATATTVYLAPTNTSFPTAIPTDIIYPTVLAPTPESGTTTIIRGGTLNCAGRVEQVDSPATFTVVSVAQPWRLVIENLTHIDPQGISHPHLLESWKASDDLKTWTLVIRKGIKFNNGQDLTADDVLYNFKQWLSGTNQSPMFALLSYLDPTGVEKTDQSTITLHLKQPTIFVPEHLAHFTAGIVPASFGGSLIKDPVGTGAFTMQDYVVGQSAHLKARADYWRKGTDGKPLPYLDQIIIYQLGSDRSNDVSAYQSGKIDLITEPTFLIWQALKDDQNSTILSIPTSATRVLKMRADQDPWTKNEVRQALKYCHNRERILKLALQNQGTTGNDSHVAPAQPEYSDIGAFPFDTAKSKDLLTSAGITMPLKVELTVASDWPEAMAYAQALKEDAINGGFDISLKLVTTSDYWSGVADFNMSITWWTHTTLAPMTLAAAYGVDDAGQPIPGNESHWVDKEFDDLLTQSLTTLDIAKRKDLVKKMEQIQKDRGTICLPFFTNVWNIYTKKVHGIEPSPDEYTNFYEAWKES